MSMVSKTLHHTRGQYALGGPHGTSYEVSFLASHQVVSRKRFLQTTHNYLYIKKEDAISPTENWIITLKKPIMMP